MTRASDDAQALLDLARERGIHHVVVCVGYENGDHHCGWRGTGLAIRGLFEICTEIIRNNFSSTAPFAIGNLAAGEGGAGVGADGD